MGLFTLIGEIARGVTSTLEGAMGAVIAGGLGVLYAVGGLSMVAPLLPFAAPLVLGLLVAGACDSFAQGWSEVCQKITVSYPSTLPFDGSIVSKKIVNNYLPNGSVDAYASLTLRIVPSQTAPTQTLGDLVNDIVTAFANQFNYQLNFDPTKDFEAQGNTVKWTYSSDKGLFGLGLIKTASLEITATPLTSNPDDWWDTEKPYTAQFIPLSSSMNGMKIYVIAVLKDGKTDALKGYQIVSFDAPAVRIKAQPSEFFCAFTPFVQLRPFTVYGVPISEDFKIDVQLKIQSNMPIEEGDIIEIYVGSPAPLINIIELCCSGSNTCPEQYKDNIDCSKFCTAGYYIYPKIFEDILKEFGYYNAEVLDLAKTFANVGFSRKVAVVTVSAKDITTTGVPAVYIGGFTANGKWEGFTLTPGTFEQVKQQIEGGGPHVIQEMQSVTIPNMYTEYEVEAYAYNRLVIAAFASPAVGLRIEDITGAAVSEVLDPYNILGSDDVSGFPLQVGVFNGLVGITSLRTQVLLIPYINDKTDSILYSASKSIEIDGSSCQVQCSEGSEDSVMCKTAQQVIPYFCSMLKRYYPLGVLNQTIYVFNPTLLKAVEAVREALEQQQQQGEAPG